MKLPVILSTMLATIAIQGVNADDAGKMDKMDSKMDMSSDKSMGDDAMMKKDGMEEKGMGMKDDSMMKEKGMEKKPMKKKMMGKKPSHEMREDHMSEEKREVEGTSYKGPYDYDKMQNREGGERVAGEMENPGKMEK